MANNSAYVGTGKPAIEGAIWVAPLGTTMPEKYSDTLNAAFKCLGYCSDDGLKNNNTATTQKVKSWGGQVVAESQTEKPDEFGYTLLEVRNPDVLKSVYGANNVTVDSSTGDIHVTATSDEAEEMAYVIDLLIGKKKKRIMIPKGKITTVGEITYKDDDAVGYAIKLAAIYVGNTSHEEDMEG